MLSGQLQLPSHDVSIYLYIVCVCARVCVSILLTPDIISSDVIAAPLQNKIGSGKLMGPKGVSVDRNGHVIVVDNKSCCVFIFQLNGKLVTRFGNRGNGDRQFAGRLGVLCAHNTQALGINTPTAFHLPFPYSDITEYGKGKFAFL